MKISSYYGSLAKPSLLLAHCEHPPLTFHRPRFVPVCKSVTRLHSSVPNRTRPSKSPTKNFRKREKFNNRDKDEVNPASFYTHPSLLEMKKARAENRALVYDFLKSISIDPHELDGLELPVTVDVMRERVDFLHKLGLTIEDINSYPLVLGCSVKKNMIPVLDYLGKLGLRKATFTDFLRRYPQVLHASVVVDLEPVVRYLQGMDIKPGEIPVVLENYPEVLGFKLEGTMSTSVAYLVAIGVARREIGGVLTRFPEILGMRVGRVIKPFVEYLESLGLPNLAVARLIEKRPHILGFGLNEKVKKNVKLLLECGVRQNSLAGVIARYPDIMGLDLEENMLKRRDFLGSIIRLDNEEFGRVVEKMPEIVVLSEGAMEKHVGLLKEECGLSLQQVKEMVVGCPQVLALNVDVMRQSFEYFKDVMGRPVEDLVGFPAYFTYGLESTVKPRQRMVSRRGVRCSLHWMLSCSDEKFEERMSYDLIDVEEMEPAEDSFNVGSLMEPRDEEGSDSEYEDDDDDDDDDDDYDDDEYT